MKQKNNTIRSQRAARKHGIVAFFQRQDWEDFSMKFLSVFLGIVITFSGNAWISHRKEKKDVHSALRLVRNELLDNINIMDDTYKMTEADHKAAKYLQQYMGNFEACEKDSMRVYCNQPLSSDAVQPSTDALELMKTSSLFSKISNQELALDIIRAYKVLREEYEEYDFYYKKKERMIGDAMQEEAKAVFAMQHFTPAMMWNAITSTVEGRQFLNEIVISTTFGFGHEESRKMVLDVIININEYLGEQTSVGEESEENKTE